MRHALATRLGGFTRIGTEHISRAIVWATNFLKTFPTTIFGTLQLVYECGCASKTALSNNVVRYCAVARISLPICTSVGVMMGFLCLKDMVQFFFWHSTHCAQIDFRPSVMRFLWFCCLGTHFEVLGASPRCQEFQLLPGGSVALSNDAVPTSQCKSRKSPFVLFCFRAVFARHTND